MLFDNRMNSGLNSAEVSWRLKTKRSTMWALRGMFSLPPAMIIPFRQMLVGLTPQVILVNIILLWILGKDEEQKKPRWCIIRDVLQWVDGQGGSETK